MLAGQMSRCITPPACMAATASANAVATRIKLFWGKRFRRVREARLAGVGKRDRPGVAGLIEELRHARDPAQSFQRTQLMAEPTRRRGSGELFADDGAPGRHHPSDP